MKYLLETSTVIPYIRGSNSSLTERVNRELLAGSLYISGITYYEIKRWFMQAKSGSTRRANVFDTLSKGLKNIELLDDINIFDEACKIYVLCKSKGLIAEKDDQRSVYDADILNAATSTIRNMVLVTSDGIHEIGSLKTENWMQ